MEGNKKITYALWMLLALNIGGFIDATYLAIKTMVGAPITCYAFSGCDVVAQSKYSVLFGVPLSVLGALFYAVTIILITYYLQKRTTKTLRRIAYVAIFGGVFSLYLFALQAFVIEAWCFYCVISDTIGVISAGLALWLLRNKK